MFKPKAKIKKVLQSADAAYIHSDGIAILERKKVGRGKYKSQIEIWHIIPCKIDIFMCDYHDVKKTSRHDKIDRIVCHNPRMLIGGLEYVRVSFGNTSSAMKKQDLTCTTIEIGGLNGLQFSMNDIPGMMSCRLTIQPNPYDSYTTYHSPNTIEAYKENSEHIEIYS